MHILRSYISRTEPLRSLSSHPVSDHAYSPADIDAREETCERRHFASPASNLTDFGREEAEVPFFLSRNVMFGFGEMPDRQTTI